MKKYILTMVKESLFLQFLDPKKFYQKFSKKHFNFGPKKERKE